MTGATRKLGCERADIDFARVLMADHFAVALDVVCDHARLDSDFGADSLDMIELVMRFEEALNISIADEESESCETVRDVLDLLRSRSIAGGLA